MVRKVCIARGGCLQPIAYDVIEPPLWRSRTFSPRYAVLHGSDGLGLALAAQCCLASRAIACLRRSGTPFLQATGPSSVYILLLSYGTSICSFAKFHVICFGIFILCVVCRSKGPVDKIILRRWWPRNNWYKIRQMVKFIFVIIL